MLLVKLLNLFLWDQKLGQNNQLKDLSSNRLTLHDWHEKKGVPEWSHSRDTKCLYSTKELSQSIIGLGRVPAYLTLVTWAKYCYSGPGV